MNSVVFFAELEKELQELSFAALKEIVLTMAKQVPVGEREQFLATYFRTSQAAPPQRNQQPDNTMVLLEQLEAIEQGKLTLSAELNPYFDDWHDDWEEMFEFNDEDGLASVIKQVLVRIDDLLVQGKLLEAFELAKRLESLDISVDGDYHDYSYDGFTLESFETHGLIADFYQYFLSQLVYLTYQTTPIEKRPEVLFLLFRENHRYGLTLDYLLQKWGIFDDLQDFLLFWIDYLSQIKGDLAYQLLVEALDLQTVPRDDFSFAKSVALVHPTFLGDYFKQNSTILSPSVCLTQGYEAMHLLPITDSIRSDIALLMAELVHQEAERYNLWVEAFKSRPNLVNLLRLFPLNDDRRLELHHFIHQLEHVPEHPFPLTKVDVLSAKQAALLKFFVGDIEKIFWKHVNTRNSLGWSSTFTKLGLSAYLLLLSTDGVLAQACSILVDKIIQEASFSASAFYRGQTEQGKNSQQLFWELFKKWKLSYDLTEAKKEELLGAIEQMMSRRVQAVMDGNHRAYYEECVVYLAAIGEVRESWGQEGAKQVILKSYRDKYPRRTNFRRDLRDFGLKE